MSSNTDPVVIPVFQRKADGLSGMTSSDQKTFTDGLVLSFHNVSYQVKLKSGFPFHQRIIERKILSNINGFMKPGLNAIMGPSGGSKSLFLDVLAAREDPSGLSGIVWIHEVPHGPNTLCDSDYVVQDDFVMGTLMVRENLDFSAALRLPATMTNQEKNERISKVIQDLDLDEVADSKVVTKGERKRTSIGMELIPDPSILFLDEPTTGLDWRTVNHLFRLLKRISDQGRIIIFSIHQPQYSIFKLFDSLTLLASGKLIYHGPVQKSLEYFKSAGYDCDHYNNPAEFFLDFLHKVLKKELEDLEANRTKEYWKREDPVIRKLAENFANSTFYEEVKSELDQLSKDQNKRILVRKEIPYVTSLRHQLIGISRRSFQNLMGHPQPWIAQMIAEFFRGLVVGVTSLLLKNDCTEIQHKIMVLFFLMSRPCFSSKTAMELFAVQKNLFLHEHISGYYRLSSYFFGNILSDLLPVRFLSNIIFTCTLYFMVESKPAAKGFFIMIFTLVMVALSSVSMTLAIGVGHRRVYRPTRIVDTYFTVMMIILALTLHFGTMPPQISWLQYFSIPYYGFMALQHNEFLGRNFCPEFGTTNTTCSNYVICSGEEVLIMQGISLSPWGFWQNHVVLTGLMIIFLIIAYQRLLFLKKITMYYFYIKKPLDQNS